MRLRVIIKYMAHFFPVISPEQFLEYQEEKKTTNNLRDKVEQFQIYA